MILFLLLSLSGLASASDKTEAMVRQRAVLEERYDFSKKTGPIGRDKKGFVYGPLPHPAERGHFVFPAFYLQHHPELIRTDVDFDLPDAYLPEYPPALYLKNHPELGDVSKGNEITPLNFKALLEDLLTPRQLEGVRLMMLPRNTLWFNTTARRVTEKPSHGVTCFACHVNGHTNAAFMIEPSTHKLRVDTPSLRGVGAAKLLGSKRMIKTLEDFSMEEDYFEGDHAALASRGGRPFTRKEAEAIADFLSLIDFPPARKLGPEELAGQKLFFGKANCASCHSGSDYTDNQMHDLAVEKLSGGEAQGAVKTPTLRGLKDSPPYLHDGRLPTVEDAVEFFDHVQGLKLKPKEKRRLALYLRAL